MHKLLFLSYNESCEHKVNKLLKIYNKTRYLVLFGTRWYDAINDKIRYLINEKTGITDSINHSFARFRIYIILYL